MSLCLRCDSAQSQQLSEASCNHQRGARIDAFQPCSLCGAPSRLMLLSEQARAAGIQAQGHAKLSARWVLAILVCTCAMAAWRGDGVFKSNGRPSGCRIPIVKVFESALVAYPGARGFGKIRPDQNSEM
jgi:hypothetical protein